MTYFKTYRKRFVPFLLLGAILALISIPTMAQENVTVDELYKRARTAAFENNNYDRARELAYQALERSPDYHGIRIFVARLYAWEENYEQARTELNTVLEKDPKNRRALSVLIDVENWSGNLDKALKLTNRSLEYYPDDEEFLFTKGSLLTQKEEYEEAESTYRVLIKKHPSRKARKELESLQRKQMKYTATLSYRSDRFESVFAPWHFIDFQLSRETPYGSIIGNVEYANRFSTDGVQFNLDAYPSFAEGFYAYISAGYSQSSIYPDYRFGLSLYKSLPWALEIEGGIRYLDFSSSQTTIYTGSLTKYLGNYLFTARTYIAPSSAGTSQSLNLLTRRYFGNAETYLELSGGFGSASSDIQFAEDIRRLDSWTIGIGGQKQISTRFNIGARVDYDSEEFPNFKRNRYSFRFNISYQF